MTHKFNKLKKVKSPILGLRTVIYRVPDVAKAKAWYSKAFHKEPYFNELFYVGYNIGGFELGLIPDEGIPSPRDPGILTYWGVEDVEVEFNRLLSLGATAFEQPHDVGGDIVVAGCKDPWGNVIGIIYNPQFRMEH